MSEAVTVFNATVSAQTAEILGYGLAIVGIPAVMVGFIFAIVYVRRIVRAA